ncbi:MgtC/SapB family protein [Noviherbaspirillum sp. Root189]|uniref:MgtC/SapB family protein n=1 Tax=Noviherbaspirillum sp. Root189 TaxID=1736487 RepID=UPI000710BABF|nr:MgtC/SapB family protein [Noviherbaspirillum sp. Root189]KRB88467.1 magnesium transporter MgtC [Noviherbaspirillum sp. Root189]
MDNDYVNIAVHLLGALIAGGIIGLERSYHARPAGFRTHTLVCVASSLLMLVMLYQSTWLPGMDSEMIRTDPTRMAQGIMTGIGFLGAGVIFKEGLSVRGLTTAASIWITAAIGVLIGIGFYYPAILATLLTVGILSFFRRIEAMMPSHSYAHHLLRFDRSDTVPEEEIRALLKEYGFTVANMSYRVNEDGVSFEYRMVIQTIDSSNTPKLAEYLRRWDKVRSFQLSPTGD